MAKWRYCIPGLASYTWRPSSTGSFVQRLRRKAAARQGGSAAPVEGLSVKIASYQSASGSHVTHFPVISSLALGDYSDSSHNSYSLASSDMEVKVLFLLVGLPSGLSLQWVSWSTFPPILGYLSEVKVGFENLGMECTCRLLPIFVAFLGWRLFEGFSTSQSKLAPLLVECDVTWWFWSATVALTPHSCTLHRGRPLRNAIGTRGFSLASLSNVKFLVLFFFLLLPCCPKQCVASCYGFCARPFLQNKLGFLCLSPYYAFVKRRDD